MKNKFNAPAGILLKSCPLTIAICLLFPAQASADAGIPMIILSYPVMLMALIPIIFLESYIYIKIIRVPFKRSLAASATANSVSTIAGFPLAWGLLLGLELLTTGGSCGPGFNTIPQGILTVIFESAWLCPWEDQLHWLVPMAFINSLVVAFFISVFIELLIVKKFFKTHENKVVKNATFKANIMSYILLILLGSVFLFYSIITNG